MDNEATKYLRKKEWSLGSGQCPECYGVPESKHGQPGHLTSDSLGHEAECSLAAALIELGETPFMKGDSKIDLVYENYISDDGFYSTRPKTAEGCPQIRAENEQFRQAFDAAVFDELENANVKLHRIP